MSEFTAMKVMGPDEWESVKLQFSGHVLCGSGRFSNVYATKLVSPETREVAIKNIWSDASSATENYIEVKILSHLFHPAISNLLYFYTRNANEKRIHCLILDYLPTDMGKLKEKGVKFDTLDAKLYSYQLFAACAYLAHMKVVHLDIKPQNIILDNEAGFLKLADFGNARRLETTEKKGNSYQVTRFYRPPELLFGGENFTPAIDLWSAACVSFEFFANRTLFKGKDTQDQLGLVVNVLGYPDTEDIKAMGVKRPRIARRPARGLEKFTSNTLDGPTYDFLKSLIVMNPAKRKPAKDVLLMPIFDVLKVKPATVRGNGRPLPSVEAYSKMEHERLAPSEAQMRVDKSTSEVAKIKKESSTSSSEND
ncbi:unnamed protein product [Caenorhabditis bovis]|uniref:Protein kinase domain-containing protein n=1 Tax=Caenorhabditis bovis TaxID=2654633 RepID=A0A8S1FEE8_9PELO|nr:unnamed protein product [Caenorhabditis bovis]